MNHLIYADSDFIQSLQFNFGNEISAIVSHVEYEIQSTMLRFVVQIAWNRCRWDILPFNRALKHILCHTYTHTTHEHKLTNSLLLFSIKLCVHQSGATHFKGKYIHFISIWGMHESQTANRIYYYNVGGLFASFVTWFFPIHLWIWWCLRN